MKISLSRAGEVLTISLRGDINESCDEELKDLLAKIELPTVIFDTERVELVNSLGARNWINFSQALVKRKVKMSFRRCSPAFLECCNIYPKFVPPGSIESLFVLTECSKCGIEEVKLVEQENFQLPDPLVGATCKKCSGPVRSQVDFEEYFQCLRGA